MPVAGAAAESAVNAEHAAPVPDFRPQEAAAPRVETMAPVSEVQAFVPSESLAREERIETPPPVVRPAPPAFEPIVMPPDLVLIETDPEKARVAASHVEPPAPPRPPRVRPALAPVTEEPLEQVETRK